MESSKARAALLPAVLAVSSAAIFIRWADAPPLATAFWRGAIAGMAFLPFLFSATIREQFAKISRKRILQIGLGTSVICLHQICFISSLQYTSIAASTFLTCTQPIFTAILGSYVLKERVSTRSRMALAGAIAGMAVITFSKADGGQMTGNMLALAAAVLAAVFALIARTFRKQVPLVPFMMTVHWSGSLILFIVCAFAGVSLFQLPDGAWRGLLLLGMLPTFVGHTLLNFAVGHLPAYVVSASILGEPVGATLLGMVLLHEYPTMQTVVGGVLIIACILVVVMEKSPILRPEPLED